jgi:nicotinamide-nucleotide amidase
VIAEVVSVGTELLLGEIVNSNASVIARRLADAGYDAHHQVTVGDNLDRIVEVMRIACDRTDVVVVTGGIGPTRDDLTKDAVCVVAGVSMSRDADHAAFVHDHVMRSRGIVRESVLRMADLPAGAEPLANGNGLALGLAIECAGAWLFVLPGVPKEMELMLDEEVVPRLRALSGGETVRSAVVRTRGLGESEVAHRLDALFAGTNPSIAFRIADAEVHVRITAKAASVQEADAMLAEMTARVSALLPDVLVR